MAKLPQVSVPSSNLLGRFLGRLSALIPGLVAGLLCLMLNSAPAFGRSAENSDEFHLTYDLSGSFGSTGGRGYQEISVGVNAFFYEWLAWRNSAFARFIEGTDNVYGLDTSARFILNLGDHKLGLTAFAGPGFRFAKSAGSSIADSAPFAEAGVVAKLGGIAIGGGVKSVYNGIVRSGAAQDTQYFLILAGGGSL